MFASVCHRLQSCALYTNVVLGCPHISVDLDFVIENWKWTLLDVLFEIGITYYPPNIAWYWSMSCWHMWGVLACKGTAFTCRCLLLGHLLSFTAAYYIVSHATRIRYHAFNSQSHNTFYIIARSRPTFVIDSMTRSVTLIMDLITLQM